LANPSTFAAASLVAAIGSLLVSVLAVLSYSFVDSTASIDAFALFLVASPVMALLTLIGALATAVFATLSLRRERRLWAPSVALFIACSAVAVSFTVVWMGVA
jgi:hypothetical protein